MSHRSKVEFMEKRKISAILDTKVENVQCAGGRNDGDRQHFPLQLWPNHWSPCKCSSFEEGSSSLRWRRVACPASRCTDEGDPLR
jgi:hypothetical protein